MPHCSHQYRELEYLDDHAIERRAEVNWVGEAPEEVVFVDPKLQEENNH